MKNNLYNWRYWILSLSIPLALIVLRMALTHSLTYVFYFWNLLLALVPLVASSFLDPKASLLTRRNISCLAAWFFFLPNAPYLITDMIHFQERPPFPVYVDEVIVYACAWNGVLLAYASIMRVERWLLDRYAQRPVNIALVAVFLLTGLGIYLGRFLRWNSWDMLIHPYALGKDIGIRMLYPIRYKQTWAVSLLFGGLLMAGYTLLRNQIQGRNIISAPRQRTPS
jgi:uncharacterized membrane protein